MAGQSSLDYFKSLQKQGSAPQSSLDYFKSLQPTSSQPDQPMSGGVYDYIFSKTAAGRVLSKFGQGLSEGWGSAMHSLAPAEEDILKKTPDLWDLYKSKNEETSKAFNEAWTRPATYAALLKRFEMSPFAAASAALNSVGEGFSQIAEEGRTEAKLRNQHPLTFLPDVVGQGLDIAQEIGGSYLTGQNFGELGSGVHADARIGQGVDSLQTPTIQGEGLPNVGSPKVSGDIKLPEVANDNPDFLAEKPSIEETPAQVPEGFVGTDEPGFYHSGDFSPNKYGDTQTYWPDYNLPAGRAQGIIGEGDVGYFNTRPLSEEATRGRMEAAQEAGHAAPNIPEPPVTDVNTLTRFIDPETMSKWDAAHDIIEKNRQEKQRLLREQVSLPDKDHVYDEIDRLESKKKLNSKEQQRLEDYYDFKKTYARLEEAQHAIVEADKELRDMATDVTGITEYAQSLVPDIRSRAQTEWYKGAAKYSEGLLRDEADARIKRDKENAEEAIKRQDQYGQMYEEGKDAFEGLAKAVKDNTDGIPTDEEQLAQQLLAEQNGDVNDSGIREPVKGEPAPVPKATQEPVQPKIGQSGTLLPGSSSGGSLRAVEGTGERSVRGLGKKIEAKAIEQGLVEDLGDLLEYNKLELEDQANKTAAFLNKDFNKAVEAAMGTRLPPKDILPESVFIAVERAAIAAKDVNLIRDLATKSKLIEQATTMGQRLRTLAERDSYSPTAAIREIQAAREASAKRRGQFEKAIKDVVKSIKDQMRNHAPDRDAWEKYLDGIEC